jgi:hypothetical protein
MRKTLLSLSVIAAVSALASGVPAPVLAAPLTLTINGCVSLDMVGVASGSSITLNCVTGGTSGGPPVNPNPNPTPNPTPNPPNPPSNPNPGATSCPGFSKTIFQQLDWSAAGNMKVDTYNAGKLGADGVLIASFTTGSNPGYAGASIRVGYVYWPADQQLNGKTMVISKDGPACDLAYTDGWGRTGSSTSSLPLSYGVDSLYGYQRLDPNTTYYVTIANKVGGVNTCTTGNCEFRLEISRSGSI